MQQGKTRHARVAEDVTLSIEKGCYHSIYEEEYLSWDMDSIRRLIDNWKSR